MIVVNHRMLASAVALSLFVPATASARFDINPTPPPGQAAAPAVTPPSAPAIVRPDRVAEDAGFDWGDAGIGAVGALGLSTLAIVGGQAVRGRRPRSVDSTHARSATAASK